MYRCSRIDNICDLVSYPVLARGPPTSKPQNSQSDVECVESEQEMTMEMAQDHQQLVIDEDAISLISLSQSEWKKCYVLVEQKLEDTGPPVELTPKVWQRGIRAPLGMWRVGDMERLQEHLDENLLGVDAKWLLFRSAVMSDRCIKMLQQCPPYNRPFSCSQIDALRLDTLSMPFMTTVQRSVCQDGSLLGAESEPHISLLHWLLLESKTPHLRQVQRSKLANLWHQIGQSPGRRPDLVFRVEMPETLSVPDLYRPCVFYSGPMDILHSLVAGPMDTHSTYLELHDSLIAATFVSTVCAGWENSLCGATLRTVAICEKCAGRVQVRYLLMFNGSESEVFSPRNHLLLGPLADEPVDQAQDPQMPAGKSIWGKVLCQALMEADPMFGLVAVSLSDVCGFIHKQYSGNKRANSIVSCQRVCM